MTNTLAYNGSKLITTVKSFTEKVVGVVFSTFSHCQEVYRPTEAFEKWQKIFLKKMVKADILQTPEAVFTALNFLRNLQMGPVNYSVFH